MENISLTKNKKTAGILLIFFVLSIVFSFINFKYPSLLNKKLTYYNQIINRPVPLATYKIHYTEQGFFPNNIEIPFGREVEFINDSNLPMWPASDPHPTHTDYPEFDADKDYLKGERYIFKFERSGTFGFHNHEDSLHRGIIHVVDPTTSIPDMSKTILSQRAIRDKFLKILKPDNPDSIFEVIEAIEASPSVSLNCHDIAHDLGHRAYELYGFSGAMTFSNPLSLSHTSIQDICAGGFVHGILEELALHEPDFKNKPGIMCENIPTNNKASCLHGVGHALMFSNKRNVELSLNSCRTIGNADEVSRCFEGVWMELFWGSTDHTGTDSLGWNIEKPLDTCVNTKDDAKPACFLYSPFGYLRTHTKDYLGAINLCTASSLNISDTNFCLKGIGITMFSHLKAHNLELSEPFIKDKTLEQKKAFYQGVIGYAKLSGISSQELGNTCKLMNTDGEICRNVLENI